MEKKNKIKKVRKGKIIVRLTLLIFSIIVVLYIFMAFLAFKIFIPSMNSVNRYVSNELQIKLNEIHRTNLRNFERKINDYLGYTLQKIEMMLYGENIYLNDPETKALLARMIKLIYEVNFIAVYDEKMNLIYTVYQKKEMEKGYLEESLKYFNFKPDQIKNFKWSEPYSNKIGNTINIALIKRITATKPFFIAFEIDLIPLQNEIEKIKFDAVGRLMVVDSKGKLIFHPDFEKALNRENYSKYELYKIFKIGALSGVNRFKDFNKKPMLGSYIKVKGFNWGILSYEPEKAGFLAKFTLMRNFNEVKKYIYRFTYISISLAVFILLYSIRYYYRTITLPLRRIETGLLKLLEGERNFYILPGTLDEIGRCGDALNELIKLLSESEENKNESEKRN